MIAVIASPVIIISLSIVKETLASSKVICVRINRHMRAILTPLVDMLIVVLPMLLFLATSSLVARWRVRWQISVYKLFSFTDGQSFCSTVSIWCDTGCYCQRFHRSIMVTSE